MLRFDNTVNYILNRLIFEQEETDNTEKKETVDSDENREQNDAPLEGEDAILAEIEKEYETNNNAFEIESQQKFSSGQEYVDAFINAVKKTSPSDIAVNESAFTDKLSKFASKAYGYTKEEIKDGLEHIKPAQERLNNFIVDKMDVILNYVLGEKFAKELNDNISESFLYKVIAIFFDPTGVMSWPYLRDATELYEKNKGTEDEEIYQLNLLAAQLSVVPSFAFKPIFGILTLPFRLLFGTGSKIAEKIFGAVGLRRIARSVARWINRRLPFKGRVPEKIERVARKGGLIGKVVGGTTNVGKKFIKKGLENPFKTATVISSGNIPKTVSDWKKKGEDFINKEKQAGSKPSTFGRFPSFAERSTQSF